MNQQLSDNNKPIVYGPVDGNVFSVIGAVVKTLRRAHYPDAATECRERCFSENDYDDVLTICQEYVDFEI